MGGSATDQRVRPLEHSPSRDPRRHQRSKGAPYASASSSSTSSASSSTCSSLSSSSSSLPAMFHSCALQAARPVLPFLTSFLVPGPGEDRTLGGRGDGAHDGGRCHHVRPRTLSFLLFAAARPRALEVRADTRLLPWPCSLTLKGACRLNLGEAFIECSEEAATEYCEKKTERLSSQMASLQEEESSILERQKVLKPPALNLIQHAQSVPWTMFMCIPAWSPVLRSLLILHTLSLRLSDIL